MKTKAVFFLFIVFQLKSFSQVFTDDNAPKFKFETEEIDYGTIKYNENGDREFKFTNVGKEPLIISNVVGSSSSVMLEWPKEPVQPGAGGVIKVHYPTEHIGAFRKSIFITSNTGDNAYKVIRIKGVVKPDPTSATLAKFRFETEVIDYGTIPYAANGWCEFKFTNTGNAPLIISTVRNPCGCISLADWPKGPILQRASGSIRLFYDTKRVGPIEKIITIESNADRPMLTLRIKGNVLPPLKKDTATVVFPAQ